MPTTPLLITSRGSFQLNPQVTKGVFSAVKFQPRGNFDYISDEGTRALRPKWNMFFPNRDSPNPRYSLYGAHQIPEPPETSWEFLAK